MSNSIVHPAAAQLVELPDSFDAINDYFYDQGWTDGLPIVPPTRERVGKMLAGHAVARPDELIAVIPPAMGQATLTQDRGELRDGRLPPRVSAGGGRGDPGGQRAHYGLAHRQTTTHAGAPLILVNGPIVKTLKINYGTGCFGPGWRANATIGRGLRLNLVNLGGAIPGEVDFCQPAHPGKYTYCIAEYEDANPWEPLHVERGFERGQSVVTVVNCEAPHSMTENIQTDPVEIMRTFASTMATLGSNNIYSQGTPVLVLGPEHASYINAAGWTKRDVKNDLFERARQPWGLVKNRGKSKGPKIPECVDQNDDNSMVPVVCEADDLIVIVAGGAGGKSMWCPTAGGQSLAVSKAIETGPR